MTTMLDIARGLDSTLFAARPQGTRSNVGVGEQDLASSSEAAGGVALVAFPTDAEVVSFVSDSVNDTAGGTGARTLRVFGLGEDWLEQEESVALNGATPVATAKKYVRVNGHEVETAGSGGVNAGRILASQAVNGVVDAILAGAGRSHPGRYTVPANRYAYLVALHIEASALSIVRLLERRLGVVRELAVLGSLDARLRHAMPQRFSPKTDLVLRAKAASGTSQITAGLELLLEAL